MSEPFLAEIRMMGFNFAPRGWAHCDGQILPIGQNQSLYSLIGTTYGGDGRTTFALPDLRGRSPIHVGNGHPWGERGGRETVTLTEAQIPSHDHTLRGSTTEASPSNTPDGNVLGALSFDAYRPSPDDLVPLAGVATVGGGQAHNNMQPSLVLSFCVALQGSFPSRN